jgi:hypothetical protein
MSLAELRKQALDLPENERALLAASLLETLPPIETEVSDEQALQRDADLDSGLATEISHEEFARRVKSERGQ